MFGTCCGIVLARNLFLPTRTQSAFDSIWMSCNLKFLISHPPAVVLAAMSETQNATFHSPRLLATVNSLNSCSGVSARPQSPACPWDRFLPEASALP